MPSYPFSRSLVIPVSTTRLAQRVAQGSRALRLVLLLSASAVASACGGRPVMLDFPPSQRAALTLFDSACAQVSRTKNDVRSDYLVRRALDSAQVVLASRQGWVARIGAVSRLADQRTAVLLLMGRAHLSDTLPPHRGLLPTLATLELGEPVRINLDDVQVSPALTNVLPWVVDQRPKVLEAKGVMIHAPALFGGVKSVKAAVCEEAFVGAIRAIRRDSLALPQPKS